jgi:hypothetical protein
MLAVERGRTDVARVLLAAGANPNGGVSPRSPLEVARDKNLVALVALLEESGASDERRQAMVAELGDEARYFFRTPPELPMGPAGIGFLDFTGMSAHLKQERATKILARRERLEAEVARVARAEIS